MRKTKIVCTLGPANDDEKILKSMIEAGMNAARFNFSHGTHEQHLERYNRFCKIREEMNAPIPAILDTKGPEVRLKSFKNGEVFLKQNSVFTLTRRDIEGDETVCSVTYKDLAKDIAEQLAADSGQRTVKENTESVNSPFHAGAEDLKCGVRILLDDGLIELQAIKAEGGDVVCKVINGGVIKDNKGVNIPGVRLSMPYISHKDYDDIIFGIQHGFDFIAASFVSDVKDIIAIKTILDSQECEHTKIIAKIENQDGVDNIEEILELCDGIMIARGDMGVEIEFSELPSIQKNIIRYCYNMGKPVITATQMLESMTGNPRPTRAEVSDVANAIYDGTSAVMLSGETAIGKYPVEAVAAMNS
ncbi:MAG: pyruvate kinase, partial [Oscillospiraceae bacterium]|nr:pyruvate kinase [Oscillospiraceae bacterium]